MHRVIATFLLLVALAGNLAPLALAATAAQAHACCVRKAAHHCHDSAVSETGQLAIRDATACNHDCCRAVTTPRWAHAQRQVSTSCAQNVETYLSQSSLLSPSAEVCRFQSTRAPPSC